MHTPLVKKRTQVERECDTPKVVHLRCKKEDAKNGACAKVYCMPFGACASPPFHFLVKRWGIPGWDQRMGFLFFRSFLEGYCSPFFNQKNFSFNKKCYGSFGLRIFVDRYFGHYIFRDIF